MDQELSLLCTQCFEVKCDNIFSHQFFLSANSQCTCTKVFIRVLVNTLYRDGTGQPIVHVHTHS